MIETNRADYEQFKNNVPEHPKRVKEWRKSGRLYYERQEVFDSAGLLVAVHDSEGRYWVLG